MDGSVTRSLLDYPPVPAARDLATFWHRDQVRKYTGFPYVTHCERVAALTALEAPDPKAVAAAWLHDVLEDTDCPPEAIEKRCGAEVLRLVREVTDVSRPEDGNRETRKALDREHLRRASTEGKIIKLADLVDNTLSIVFHDPDFAQVYLDEKEQLLNVLCFHWNSELYKMAWRTLRMAQLHIVDLSLLAQKRGLR